MCPKQPGFWTLLIWSANWHSNPNSEISGQLFDLGGGILIDAWANFAERDSGIGEVFWVFKKKQVIYHP